MRSLHGNDWGTANEHFVRAASLDPDMAEAHMRAAMTYIPFFNPEQRRAEYTRAAAIRASMTERDRALLDALEPILQFSPPDSPEAIRRRGALTARNPSDAEMWMWLAIQSYATPAALAPPIRATELDPQDGQSWETRGTALAVLGRMDEAREAYEKCSAIVAGPDCYSLMGMAAMMDGRCKDMERAFRRSADRAPFAGTYAVRSAELVAGAPASAVEETRARAIDTTPEAQRALWAATARAQIAVVSGDFSAGAPLLVAQAKALAADPTARADHHAHYALAMADIGLRLETGRHRRRARRRE